MNAGAQHHADKAEQRDLHLGDIVAEYDCSITAAGKAAGFSKAASQRGWQRILARLGDQAR
jgi:hypothetical protein